IVCTAPGYSGSQREPVYVTTPAGGPASPSSGGELNYGPNVTAVSPSSGVAGTSVTISGSNLTGATDATFGGVSVGITVNSDGSAVAVAPTPTSSGAVDIGVDNGAGSSATGRWDRFTWSKPAISALSPNSGLAGSPVTISGSGFTGASGVNFGTTAATFSVASDGSISTSVPATLGPGAVNVTVITPAGTSAGSAYTVTLPAPTVTSITPNTGVSNTAIAGVVIAGSDLGGATVTFGGVAATVTSPGAASGPTSITVTAPASATDTTVDVVVTTPYGTATVTGGFTYTG
ncbi:MAG TPA: IPT/TIG domain-containing protein, partial [Actinomycetota bacterium]|nr:IPT/TIG domain-containing protein [Actinomycetota bacterium]